MNLALIGLGSISSKYKKGLEESNYNLVAVIDKNRKAKGRVHYSNVPFYESLADALINHKIDVVLIATPPDTHYEIAKSSLLKNVHVFVEKVSGLTIFELEELLKLSSSQNKRLVTLYHWQYGDEVLELQKLDIAYQAIKSVEVFIDDPYCINSTQINENFISLKGTTIDSLPNALSLLSLFMDVSKFKLIEKNEILEKQYSMPIASSLSYMIENKEIHIKIDWRNDKNNKKTVITFNDNKQLILEHTLSRLTYLTKQTIANIEDRLESHYINLFKHINLDTYDFNNMIEIHKVFFKTVMS